MKKKDKNKKLFEDLKIEAMRAKDKVCAELSAGAMASVHKKAKIKSMKYSCDAYKTSMKAISALKQIVKELIKINKILK